MNQTPEDDLPDHSLLFHQLRGLVDWNCGWYQKWYFMVRLEEEIIRSRQYGHQCSLVVLTLLDPPKPKEERDKLYAVLAELTFGGFRLTDVPGVLSFNEYALLLPETDLDGARAVALRLKLRLARFSPVEGIAVFPDEASSAESLVETAFAMGWRDQETLKGIQTMPS